MKQLVIDSKGRQIVPPLVVIGLLSLPLLGLVFFREQFQSALFYCRETIVVQYGTHPLILVGLVCLALIITISCSNVGWLLIRELRQTRAVRRWAMLRLVGVHEAIILVQATEPLAITVGYLRPTIIYSTGLLALLSESEVEAVLAHEVAHQTRRDPLRRLGLYSVMKFCFFWPALNGLTRYYVAQQEARADRAAAVSVGQTVVTSSIKKVLSAIVSPHTTGLSGCAFSFSPERLLASESGIPRYHFQFSLNELLGSGFSLLVMVLAVLVSVTSVQAEDVVVDHNQLCRYVAEHEVMVGFSPLINQSANDFESVPQAYLLWRP